MEIGSYTITPIVADTFGLDGGAMFGIIPKPLWEKQCSADDRNRVNLATRVLLIEGKNRKILIDTGNGNKWDDKYREIYKIDPGERTLGESLASRDIRPDDITDVILTHLHFDHAGGATTLDNGEPVPTFPNATYYVQESNWKWANDPTEKDTGSYRKENFIPLREHGVLELVRDEVEIFPGINLVVCDGHTKGRQLPLIADENQSLFYCGDLVPTTAHLSIPWVMGYDNFPLTTIEEKKEYLARAVEENWTLLLEHDPNTVAITVRREDGKYRIKQTVRMM
ncbi:MAG: MBL fold metallo-hydrolase [Candidatus Marinimicrobia bacterium]|nr:MBL fold metallo-hydrolase [Candidatus Neomarinimicrobiota bacterium]MCF7830309.1 MBL fold metallo-hydrolase [Candidatus Neomarinimicrobiota bacterium]MCF7882465.1 MBL fold metallo-hydrolase [Candidatus Neomarinimicrobiota bacterium]